MKLEFSRPALPGQAETIAYTGLRRVIASEAGLYVDVDGGHLYRVGFALRNHEGRMWVLTSAARWHCDHAGDVSDYWYYQFSISED